MKDFKTKTMGFQCVKWPLSKRSKNVLQDPFSLNAGPREHSAILSTNKKPQFVIKIFVFNCLLLYCSYTQICNSKICV